MSPTSEGAPLLRTIFAFVSFVVLTLLGSLLAISSGLVDRTGDAVLWLGRWWSRGLLASAGVRLEVRVHGHLEPDRPYIFASNHLSMIDIFAVLVAIPVQFRFIAKKQLGAIPIFGWAMRAGRFIFIDRQNPVLARRSIDEAAKRIRAGQSVVIFPEGTRSRDGRLAPFKQGGFHLALDSGADIVPVGIRGSHELMPRGSAVMRPGKVTIEIGEPIPTAGLGADDRLELVARVRARIAEMSGQVVAEG
jgi:1-acyl-sn-glycerol-3-phosphate acyltransferase